MIKVINKSKNPLPQYKTTGSACMDIMSNANMAIAPGETVIVPTGLYMEIHPDCKVEIYSRSGLASIGIVVANAPGQIDSDYRDEVGVILRNDGDKVWVVMVGDRIAQMAVVPIFRFEWQEVDELSETDRKGGFGSTGR